MLNIKYFKHFWAGRVSVKCFRPFEKFPLSSRIPFFICLVRVAKENILILDTIFNKTSICQQARFFYKGISERCHGLQIPKTIRTHFWNPSCQWPWEPGNRTSLMACCEWDLLLDGWDPVTPDAPLGPWLTSPVRSVGRQVWFVSWQVGALWWVVQWARGSAGGKIHSSRAPSTSMEERWGGRGGGGGGWSGAPDYQNKCKIFLSSKAICTFEATVTTTNCVPSP